MYTSLNVNNLQIMFSEDIEYFIQLELEKDFTFHSKASHLKHILFNSQIWPIERYPTNT